MPFRRAKVASSSARRVFPTPASPSRLAMPPRLATGVAEDVDIDLPVRCDLQQRIGGQEERNRSIGCAQCFADVVEILVEVVDRRRRVEFWPERVEDLFAVQRVLRLQGEELDERFRLAAVPGTVKQYASPNTQFQSAEQLDLRTRSIQAFSPAREGLVRCGDDCTRISEFVEVSGLLRIGLICFQSWTASRRRRSKRAPVRRSP